MENGRVCTNCKTFKLYSEYSKNKKGANGYREQCKKCTSLKGKEHRDKIKNTEKEIVRRKVKQEERKRSGYYGKYRESNRERLINNNKIYYLNNKEKLNKQSKENYELNKEKILLQMKKHRENNKEIIKKRKQKYYKENKEKIRERSRVYEKERYPTKCKIIKALRNRIRTALKLYKKSESSKKLLGCDLEFYKNYLESKFTSGMTWENFKLKGWHVDHIRPCDSFDLSDPEQQKKCFHYTNTQPLWATREIAMIYGEGPDYIGNLEKGNKII